MFRNVCTGTIKRDNIKKYTKLFLKQDNKKIVELEVILSFNYFLLRIINEPDFALKNYQTKQLSYYQIQQIIYYFFLL